MDPLLKSLHHVTATVDEAQPDLEFYSRSLGLRLVKKTVNFDNHYVYHFYYGNEHGTPSTIMTTFPYRGWGVPVGTKGAGQIRTTSFSVPRAALGFWRQRLEELGKPPRPGLNPFKEPVLTVTDPSGLILELVGTTEDTRTPWVTDAVTASHAVRGLHSVTLEIRTPERTIDFVRDLLGFRVVNEGPGRTRLAVGTGGPGEVIDILHAPDAPPAVNGLGTVHHVAFAIADAEEQLKIRAELVRQGVQVTEVRDRQYFRSIYFREPGGVLFEIATVPPGFTADETLPCLGQDLKLPPWEEPHRATIETKLPALQ
ncbi:MAG TPA: ring-cleaving dioxygenase [Gemmatimonadales bacterium]|nr:ring-cleaving dioxygenase [Gemmatimonadales bacterium]